MGEIRNFDLELQTLKERSVDRLLMSEFFDEAAFEALFVYVSNKAELVADDFVVSKQLLDCVRSAETTIIRQAEHLPQVRFHISKANDFSMLLDLIISGEKPSHRQPGIPRII